MNFALRLCICWKLLSILVIFTSGLSAGVCVVELELTNLAVKQIKHKKFQPYFLLVSLHVDSNKATAEQTRPRLQAKVS